MNVCFVIVNLEHYRYFYSDRNENESLITLGKKYSVIKRISNYASNGKNVPEWVYKITLRMISQDIDIEKIDILVVTDLAQIRLPRGFVKWLKKIYPNLKTVMMFHNKVATLYGLDGNINMESFPDRDIMLPFDKIYTYDPNEASAYGFEYFVVVSDVSHFLSEVDIVPKSDVFFCGSVKHEWKTSRFEVVDEVYQYLTDNHVNCDFHVVFSKDLPLPKRNYVGTKRLSYLETIKHSINTRVLLEIVADGQYGITERFYDALMYNKKFITNNETIQHHPCYDERFMRVFNNPSDIDIAWLLDNETVNYHYDGKYTPKGMYEKLKELI